MNSKTTHCGVGLLAADMQVMVTFYRDVLGLETDWDGGNFAEFYTANGRLALFMYDRKMFDEAMKPEFRPPRGINQTFEIGHWLPAFADVDAEYEKLRAKGQRVWRFRRTVPSPCPSVSAISTLPTRRAICWRSAATRRIEQEIWQIRH